jgi:C-terminal processing protease CtpA/Prc
MRSLILDTGGIGMSEYQIGKDVQELRHRIELLEHAATHEKATSDRWWQDHPDVDRQALGIVFHKRGDKWIVHRALLGSPAEAAGVQQGDVLHEIIGKAIEASIRPTKLAALIEILDTGSAHKIGFLRGEEKVSKEMRPRVLRELLELDVMRGGAARGYCLACPRCRPSTSGVTVCSDCPSYTCTIG